MNTRYIYFCLGGAFCLLSFASCSCDPREGGIFWSESCAKDRLATLLQEKKMKESRMSSLQSEIKALKKQSSRASVRSSEATSPTANTSDSATNNNDATLLRNKEIEYNNLKNEVEKMKREYGALLS